MKRHPIFILLICLYACMLVLKLYLLPHLYQVDDGDTARDYMVARHIAYYNEYPRTGPNISFIDSLRASPLYYYLLAIPVRVYDSTLSIGVFNILIQAISVISLCVLAYILFGPTTALVCAVALLFSQELFSQSFFMIQSHMGQLFFNVSYALLAFGYIRQRYQPILFSSILFTLGCTVSFHGFPVLCGYLALLFVVLRKIHVRPRKILATYALMLLFSGAWYFPMVWLAIHNSTTPSVTELFSILKLPSTNILSQAGASLLIASSDWLRSEWLTPSTKHLIFWYTVATSIVLVSGGHTKAYVYARIIALYILPVIFLASLVPLTTYSYQYDAIAGLILIVLCFTATHAYRNGFVGNILTAAHVILLLLLNTPSPGYFQWIREQIGSSQKLALKIAPLVTYLDVQKQKHPDTWSQFQIAVYNGIANNYHWKDSVVLNELEQRYDIPFVTVSNRGYSFDMRYTKSSPYIIVCDEYASVIDAKQRCLSEFLQSQKDPLYDITMISNTSHDQYTVFWATRKKD